MQSKATSRLNLQVGYRVADRVKITLDIFNLPNAAASDSDIDYFYTSRYRESLPAGTRRPAKRRKSVDVVECVNVVFGF